MKNLVIFILVLGAFSCKKDPPIPPEIPDKYEDGVLVLNEGLFEQNNASISFYDGTESFQLVFESENSRGLGDTANDFEAYSIGGEDYIIIAVDVSSQVEIIERTTMKTVAQIPLFDGINAREPRRIKVLGDIAFVCNFDGTVAIIDLTTNALVTLVEVGANPDGLVVVGDKLYVSNSGGLHYPVYDSTISVINTTSYAVETTFETRINSTQMVLDGQGEIYLVSRGNYDDIPPAMLRIDTETNTVLDVLELPISSLVLYNDWLYFYHADDAVVYRYNTLTETIDPTVIVDLSSYETFFGFHIDPITNRIYCIDANGYVNSSTISVYQINGDYLFQFQAGLNANDFIFNN